MGRRHHVAQSEIEETGLAASALGHAGLGVAWLANKLGAHGVAQQPPRRWPTDASPIGRCRP